MQIRDGLHVLGPGAAGEAAGSGAGDPARRQLVGGEHTVPGLRQALGLAEDGADERTAVDAAETAAGELVARCR